MFVCACVMRLHRCSPLSSKRVCSRSSSTSVIAYGAHCACVTIARIHCTHAAGPRLQKRTTAFAPRRSDCSGAMGCDVFHARSRVCTMFHDCEHSTLARFGEGGAAADTFYEVPCDVSVLQLCVVRV
jgi:hypothetical protein